MMPPQDDAATPSGVVCPGWYRRRLVRWPWLVGERASVRDRGADPR